MKIISLIFFFSAFVASQLNAQEFGFFGKKNFVSFSATGNPRVLSGINHDLPLVSYPSGYVVSKYDKYNSLDISRKIFRYDFRASYKRLLNRNFALGLEFSYERMALPKRSSSDILYIYDQYGYEVGAIHGSFSNPVFNVTSYLLTIELFDRGNVAPAGFSTSFGVGPKFFSFKENENYRYAMDHEMAQPFPKYDKSMMAIDAFVDFTYRLPVNRFLMFDIGVRIRSGYIFKRSEDYTPYVGEELTTPNNDAYVWTKNKLISEMRTENTANFINLKLGFTLAL